MKMLQEDNGNTSGMRIGMFIVICSACYVAIIGVYKGEDLLGLGILVTGMLGVAIGGKALQKGREGQPST